MRPVRFSNVSFSYGDEQILEKISFDIEEGALAAVIGPNGGGKTTILRLILGLLEPDEGRIEIFGSSPSAATSGVGYVPQYTLFDPLFPASVSDVVLMGRLGTGRSGFLSRLGPYKREDRRICGEKLEMVGLEGLEERPFSDLSGGQRQRVLIARALAGDAKLLLLDEPTSNVDRKTEKEIYAILASLKKDRSIMMVSHDTGVVSALADTILCVNRTLLHHPGCELTGEMLGDLYGSEMQLVLHDQGHNHKAGCCGE